MNRYLVSWSPKVVSPTSIQSLCMTLSGDERGRCCLMREQPDAWVRNYEETDWIQLSQVLKTSFASQRQDKVSRWCVYQYENDLYGGSEERRQQMQLEHERRAPKRDTSKKPKNPKRQEEAPIYCGGIVTAKAQRALALLKHIPRPVRRGLPVLVNAQGLLLAFPVCVLQLMKLRWEWTHALTSEALLLQWGVRDSLSDELDVGCVGSWFSALPLDFCICCFPPSNTCWWWLGILDMKPWLLEMSKIYGSMPTFCGRNPCSESWGQTGLCCQSLESFALGSFLSQQEV